MVCQPTHGGYLKNMLLIRTWLKQIVEKWTRATFCLNFLRANVTNDLWRIHSTLGWRWSHYKYLNTPTIQMWRCSLLCKTAHHKNIWVGLPKVQHVLCLPFVRHKGVAEVSKTGNLKERLVVVKHGWQNEATNGSKSGWSVALSICLLSICMSLCPSVHLSIWIYSSQSNNQSINQKISLPIKSIKSKSLSSLQVYQVY